MAASRTLAEAHVSERGGQVVLELWADEPDVPAELGAALVRQAFALPPVRADRPVLVCLPRRSGELLPHVRRRVQDASTRAAGSTCLVEGRVEGRVGAAPSR